MSYRTIKRVLGETSLERKCRFLFGSGLMLLITGSFYFYAQLNLSIIREQNRERARLLVVPNLLTTHWEWSEPDSEFRPMLDELDVSIAAPTGVRDYTWDLMKANLAEADAGNRPADKAGYVALQELLSGIDENQTEYVYEDRERGEYQYYAAVRAKQSCLNCHYHGRNEDLQPGDMIGMAKITFELEEMEKAIARNNAVLIAMAIVTAFLAMLAAYAIVRYVIVKPVLHLKDVSDAIAHGELDQRADIRTGDEFEELSHAFNRMLRHLVTVQDELRETNTALDSKVDELAQANLSLHEMNKLKNEFLATMSHELRTPLNSILGFSDVLEGASNLNDRQKRYLRNIRTSGQSLLVLIDDILDLAKIESGKMELHVVEFSITDVVERLVAGMQPLAEKKNIALTSRVDERIPLLRQDAGKLQQILLNLISNAVKFTPEGGRITVEALREGERLVLVVADSGVGIPLEDQDRIFEKFRQGRSLPGQQDAMTREYEGTGLGLSIVKELTKLVRGEVQLESEFGKGSTFTIRVPLELEESFELDERRLTLTSTDSVDFRRSTTGSVADLEADERPSRGVG